MLEGGTGGIVFKWINKNEIMNKHEGKSKGVSLQATIDKMHLEYIATRPGAVIDENVNHGIFGNVYSNTGELLDLEEMELKEITKQVTKTSKKNVDLFKTVLSMKEDDVARYGVDKDKWKDTINKRISDIARASNIPTESIEWCASFHSKKGNPHCHLVFWNKDQDLELNKKPFLNFKEIRKCISKEIYKEELQKMYDLKNISKKEIANMTKEDLQKYKNTVKETLKKPELEFDVVDTTKEEQILNDITQKIKTGEKIFLYNKSNPETFVEISKEVETNKRKYYDNEITDKKEVLKFRNNGERAILYKNDDFTDTGCFLSNFKEIKIAYSKEELEKIIRETNNKELEIDLALREIMPSIIPNNIFSNELREKSFLDITNRIANLKKQITNENQKAGLGEKITFRYELQQPTIKKEIDKISILILNTSKDCKLQFNNYISSSLDIARCLADISNKNDYERVKQASKDEMFNKMGNQILQFLKDNINENYNEEYEKKKREYAEKNIDYKISQEVFEQQMREKEARELINGIYNILDTNNISQNAKSSRIKTEFSNMTKEQIKEYLKIKENSSGFEWFD